MLEQVFIGKDKLLLKSDLLVDAKVLNCLKSNEIGRIGIDK